MTFAEFWPVYPRHEKKRDAEKAYNQVMRRGITHDQIMKLLEERKSCDWLGRLKMFIPLAGSFLRGEDFTDDCEAREDDREGTHWCTMCEPEHEHVCSNPENCTAGHILACPAVLARLKR